jgi:glycosyltransferase involved in cell wall biosynthesis
MKNAFALIFPSVWYEGLPVTIVEAYAAGLPVIAGKLGSMSTLIVHGQTGLHFRHGDSDDLAARIEWAFAHPAELARMRRQARVEFEAKYTAKQNYEMLMNVYEMALEQSKSRRESLR